MPSEHGFAARVSKAAEFLDGPDLDAYRIVPMPWREPGTPYHFARPLRNPDGHGGYSRVNRFDADGIPYSVGPQGPVYHPLIVARYAMKMQAISFATGDGEAARRARGVVPAFLAAGAATAAWGAGPSADRMIAGTPSCIVQGVVISCLIRLYAGRPPVDVAALIDRAIDRLIRPVEEGGTLSSLEGGPFLEEMPATRVSYILNGCFYGLFGLYDAADALGHPEAARVAAGVERTISRAAARFTTPWGWSYYALDACGRRYLARAYYHATHIVQACVVAERTGDEPLARAAQVWRRALRSAPTRLLFAGAKIAQVVWMRDLRRLPLEHSTW